MRYAYFPIRISGEWVWQMHYYVSEDGEKINHAQFDLDVIHGKAELIQD